MEAIKTTVNLVVSGKADRRNEVNAMIKLKRPIFISVGKNILMDVIFSNIVTGVNYKFHCALLRLEPENPIYEYQPVRIAAYRRPEEINRTPF
jgi:hypothetical protein